MKALKEFAILGAVLSLLMVGRQVRAEEFTGLFEVLKAQLSGRTAATTPEVIMALLPAEMRSNHVLMYASKSSQFANELFRA